jgi:hypothetical protein
MQERRATSVTRRSFTLIGITMMIRVLGLLATGLAQKLTLHRNISRTADALGSISCGHFEFLCKAAR